MRTLKLNEIHNLTMNCSTEKELNEYLTAYRVQIKTKLAGEHTKLPMYYLQASKVSGLQQDRYGNWYG